MNKTFHISLLIILFLLIFSFGVSAKRDTTKVKESALSHLIIKHCPLNHLDLGSPSFQLSFEYNVFRRWNIEHEIGYLSHHALIFTYFDRETIDYELKGYRIRTDAKFYPLNNSHSNKFYVGASLMFRQRIDNSEKTYMRYDGLYNERISGAEKLNTWAFHLKTGYQFFPRDSWFVFELYCGLGFRIAYMNSDDLPDDAQIMWEPMFSLGEFRGPSITLGFKLGFVIF